MLLLVYSLFEWLLLAALTGAVAPDNGVIDEYLIGYKGLQRYKFFADIKQAP